MYLKSIEIIGFKSFAQRTRLVFEPGITAVVGPNGCGKSNISDAIRWVLGEQRPTVLRGSAMSDVIFNGSENRKPLGMAEVSIVFSDCEDALGTEFHEVTVSRRVFRSGEGQYFLNKKPCRLRDVQRLFMDTGVGTASYSVMAQGQIDAILSSRPEDRRAVFEEASGITRFKADRRDALRKLEQTEANLARVSDILREIKRNIGSLQRQATKARKFQELQEELKQLDLFVSSGRIHDLDKVLEKLQERTIDLTNRITSAEAGVSLSEKAATDERATIAELDERITRATEAMLLAQNRLSQIQASMQSAEQRIREYGEWEKRDRKEIEEIQAAHATQSESVERLRADLTRVKKEAEEAVRVLEEARTLHETHRKATETARSQLQSIRAESLERERTAARAQATLSAAEAAAREAATRLERLTSEKEELDVAVKSLETTASGLETEHKAQEKDATARAAELAEAEGARKNAVAALRSLEQQIRTLSSSIAAHKARIQMLEDRREADSGLPGGSRLLLDRKNPLGLQEGVVVGPLAEHISAPPAWRTALETALRPWLDAIVVRDASSASHVLSTLVLRKKDAETRLIVLPEAATETLPPGEELLLSHLVIAPGFEAAAAGLLGHVVAVESVEAIPLPIPRGRAYVTQDGVWMDGEGHAELRIPGAALSNPLARRAAAEDARSALEKLEMELSVLQQKVEAETAAETEAQHRMDTARKALDETRSAMARKAGELSALRRELSARQNRLLTIQRDLERLKSRSGEEMGRTEELAATLKTLLADRDRLAAEATRQAEGIPALEQTYAASQATLSEARLRESSLSQHAGHLASQVAAGETRLAELLRTAESRRKSCDSYADGVERLKKESQEASANIPAIQDEIKRQNDSSSILRNSRNEHERRIAETEQKLREERAALEAFRKQIADAELQAAEARLRRQNHVDRLVSEYKLAAEEPLPEAAKPTDSAGNALLPEAIDEKIASLRTAIEELGPVNLVAVEEYQQLEERHAFLAEQEEDLTRGKAEILDLIRRINQESTELFKDTFEKANAHFQTMFARLFNGGQAQLMLLDGDDILECGIDIVARPPGKRLQNVSLLSGGERTMTAVALLFAIYMVKPSPFALLDELDAALDDSNIGRFVDALKGFLTQSQFLIITHNQHTIAGADIVYGVTMPEKGVSKILSIRLKKIGVEELDFGDSSRPSTLETEAPTLRPRGRSRAKEEEKSADAPELFEEPAGEAKGETKGEAKGEE